MEGGRKQFSIPLSIAEDAPVYGPSWIHMTTKLSNNWQ